MVWRKIATTIKIAQKIIVDDENNGYYGHLKVLKIHKFVY